MENKTIVILLLIVLGITSCNEDGIPSEQHELTYQTSSNYGYELLWEIPLRADSLFENGVRTLIKGDHLYYSRSIGEVFSKNDELVCVNKEHGNTAWTWTNEDNGFFTQPIIEGNDIYFENENKYYALDRITGGELWAGEKTDGNLRRLVNNELNLSGHINYGSNQAYLNKIVEIDKTSGDLDTLLIFPTDDEFYHYLNHPQIFLNEDGDKIVLYFYKRVKYSPGEKHLDFVKYNLTKDSVEWKRSDFAFTNGAGTKTPPIIIGDRIYLHCVRDIFCFDLNTGEEIWKNEYTFTNFDFTNFIINDGILNSLSDEGHLVGIDIMTGQQKYMFDHGAMGDGITYYDGRIYYASEDLFIINHRTGQVIHKLRTKNRGGAFFRNQVAIDEETNTMYVQDGYFMQAIKIPE